MAVEIDAARLMVWRAADLCQRDEPFEIASSKAKYYASEVAVRAAGNAIQVHGGYGFVDEYPVGKYLRDARVLTLYEGTSQIHMPLWRHGFAQEDGDRVGVSSGRAAPHRGQAADLSHVYPRPEADASLAESLQGDGDCDGVHRPILALSLELAGRSF